MSFTENYESRQYFIGDGETDIYPVNFPYINQQHVKARVGGGAYLFRWLNDGQIQFLSKPSAGETIEIYRETPVDNRLVNYTNGSVLTENELNVSAKQNFYLNQETRDTLLRMLYDALGKISQGEDIPGNYDDIIAQIAAEVLTSELYQELNSRITDIDLNAESILEQTSRLDGFKATVDSYASQLDNIDTLIQQTQQQSIDGDNALAETISLIGAKSGDGLSFIIDTNTAKVSPTESLATRLSGIDTRLGDNESSIQNEQTARVNADQALANDFTELSARVDDNESSIVQEATARSDADSAFAETLDLLGAKNANGSAFILDLATVRVNSSESLGTRLSGIETSLGDNESAIANEQTVRANADSALSQDINQVQSSVGSLSTTVQTQAQSIDGLKGQYTVKIDNNGYVSGFGLASTNPVDGSPFSEFTVLADRFAIVTPGENPVVPFVADASGVYMPNAFIRDLQVEKINGGDVNALWNLGSNGRIVMDSGTHVWVLGLGFGQYGNLVEWYGTKRDISTMNTSNSIIHKTTDGDAYFGGVLTVGTLSNSIQTTDLTTSAVAELGPYSSNGGNINILWSYVFAASDYNYGTTTCPSNLTQPVAQLRLQRSLNGGSSWSTIHTRNINGSTQCLPDFENNRTRTIEDMSGSFTYTDTLQTTTDRMYRVVLLSRSTYHAQVNVTKQVISITSTE